MTGFEIDFFDINTEINSLNTNSLDELTQSLYTLHNKIKYHLQFQNWNEVYLDSKILICFSIDNVLYQCLLTSSSNKDPRYNQIIFFFDFPLSITIGSYADIFQNKLLNPKETDKLKDLVNSSINHINEVKEYDSQNKRYKFKVVDGNIYTVSIDNKGNIKTYINGEEKNF